MTDTIRKLGGWPTLLVAALVGLAAGAGAMVLFAPPADEARVEGIVRNYLLANPEILPEAMNELDRRQAAEAIAPRRAELETPYAGAWAGAADADVTLVEFFDYACSFCRASNGVVDRLLQEDPRLKVVWRELPVLGPDSQAAALASLAAAEQGRFRQFHDALFTAGRPTGAAVTQAQAQAGVQPAAATERQRAELTRNMDLASLIRANGTPTFVVGDQVLHGAVGYDRLKQAIDAARAARSQR